MPLRDADTTLADLRERMAAFVGERAWEKYHRPKNLAMSVAIEAAELMELFQWLTPAEADELCRGDAFRREVADEMSDVLAFLLSLANRLELDVSGAFERKLAANAEKYPPRDFHGHYDRRDKPGRGE